MLPKWFAAWKQFADANPSARFPLTPRTMANFVNDHVVQEARIEFASVPGVSCFEERGLFALSFDKKLLMRLKKADEDDLTRNYPTLQQKDVRSQQLIIEGWEEATWVNAAYHFTPTSDAIDRILITCLMTDYNLWSISIYDAREEKEAETILFPEHQPRRVVVRPREVRKPSSDE